MASSRFVDPPDELRRCSELFHTEALKHINAVFAESSYGAYLFVHGAERNAHDQLACKPYCCLFGIPC